MASARCLTTAELGAIRYDAAEASGLWSVEVRYVENPNGEFAFGAVDEFGVVVRFGGRSWGGVRGAMGRVGSREWRAVVDGEVGRAVYEVRRGSAVVATGGLEVVPGEKPLGGGVWGGALKAREPTGAKQLVGEGGGQEWPVEFAFMEVAWALREVFAESAVFGRVKLTKEKEGGGFRGVGESPPGDISYRFCVVLTESTRPELAPFTRLGWDAGASHPGSLVTWPLYITVADLGADGAKAGDALMDRTRPTNDIATTDFETTSAEDEGSPVSVAIPDASNRAAKDLLPSISTKNVNVAAIVAGLDATDAASAVGNEKADMAGHAVGKDDVKEGTGRALADPTRRQGRWRLFAGAFAGVAFVVAGVILRSYYVRNLDGDSEEQCKASFRGTECSAPRLSGSRASRQRDGVDEAHNQHTSGAYLKYAEGQSL